MRWLQWATVDLAKGLGGVEVHARSMARELGKTGIETAFSSDPDALSDPLWDVVHTHGSAVPVHFSFKRYKNKKSVHVHTLHGTTLGRMAACGEWTWPGGYAAASRELGGVLAADVVLAVQPDLHLLTLARKLHKKCEVCWNGWDAGENESLPVTLEAELKAVGHFWVFVGRGDDYMKGVDVLVRAISLVPELNLVAVPGAGFETVNYVKKTGVLSSGQVRTLMRMADGLILSSRYEGYPLVVLEALAQGTPVVATAVGGVASLPDNTAGLIKIKSGRPEVIAKAIRESQMRFPEVAQDREIRIETNRGILLSWKKVAEIAEKSVKEYLAGRK